MSARLSTYSASDSAAPSVRQLDARAKIALLAAYSVMLFLVGSWLGVLAATALLGGALAASCVPVSRVLGSIKPIYVLASLTVVLNSLTFVQPDLLAESVSGQGLLVPLVGGLCFTGEGLMRGCFFAVRILLLTYAFALVGFSTTSTQMMNAVAWFLRPLRALGVPTDDAAMVCSLALRFIPLAADELRQVRNAQWSRGGKFDEGAVVTRLQTWLSALVCLVAGMFRRADTLALAMDARCYGAVDQRTTLGGNRFSVKDAAVLVLGVMVCAAVAVGL